MREDRSPSSIFSTPFVSPFYSNTTLVNGTVVYELITDVDDDLVQQLKDFVADSQGLAYSPLWMLVAKWTNLCDYEENGECTEVSILILY